MKTRRTFLSASATAFALGRARGAARSQVRIRDLETRIARRDLRGITKEDLPTPCLILDLDLFEKNLRHMAAHSQATGLQLRPHVKIHKSPEICRRQLALGAIGVSCATVAECELMASAGIRNILWTRQPAGKNNIQRAVALAKKDPTSLWVADDPITVDLLNEAAAAAGTKMTLLVDCYAGLTRAGIQTGEKALALARRIDQSKHLKLAGLMAYAGWASHTKGWQQRYERSMSDIAGMLETAELCRKSGLNTSILSGGSTGTYNIDTGKLTELQCGSYVFMDTGYMHIGSKDGSQIYHDFAPALTVMTTVVSRTRDGMCTIDAGNKAMLKPTDEVKGRKDIKIENQGAEYGLLLWKQDPELKLGERVEIYPTNLDTSTNVYDRYYVTRGENLIDVWPIMGRAGAAQR